MRRFYLQFGHEVVVPKAILLKSFKKFKLQLPEKISTVVPGRDGRADDEEEDDHERLPDDSSSSDDGDSVQSRDSDEEDKDKKTKKKQKTAVSSKTKGKKDGKEGAGKKK